MHNSPSSNFRLEINSLEEFVAFVAVIRGEVLDDARLKELAVQLRTSTAALKAEVDEQSQPLKE